MRCLRRRGVNLGIRMRLPLSFLAACAFSLLAQPVLAQSILAVGCGGSAFNARALADSEALQASASALNLLQWMPLQAVGSPCPLSTWAVTLHNVVPVRHQAQVRRIATGRVDTRVIDREDIKAARDRGDQPCVHDAVQGLKASPQHDSAVALNTAIAIKDPAASRRVDVNLGKDARELRAGQVRNGEILSSSHDAASRAVLGLEPLRCTTTVAARSLYPTWMAA